MTEQQHSTVRRRTGGRSARIREQVFRAVLEELMENGLSGLTMPAIGQKAGVHPTTLYRRWPDVESVVLDSILDRSEASVAIPDTGFLAGDLERFLADLNTYIRSPLGRALLALQLSARGEVERLRQRFWQDRFEKAARMIERAATRGEIPAQTSASARQILEFAIAPVYLHAAVLGNDFDEKRMKAHVRRTLAMAREP